MNFFKVVGNDVLQTVGLVPAKGKDVDRDLAADGILELEFRKLSLQGLDEVYTNVMLTIILLELQTLFIRTISSDRRHIDHALAKLDKGASLLGDLQIRDVTQQEIDQRLIPFLSKVLDKALHERERTKR